VGPRRRDMSTLQTLGASRAFMLKTLVVEGAVLVLVGGAAGVSIAGLLVYALRNDVSGALGADLLLPSTGAFAGVTAGGLVLTAALVGAAVSVVIVRAGLRDKG